MEDLKTPWELFGVECGEGWFSLIEPILQYIQSYNKDKAEEYQKVEQYLFNSGIEDGFVQEDTAASADFIPIFDGTGV